MKDLKVEIPNGFMNIGVSGTNRLFGDTNDSANWDTFSFPLPKPNGKWVVSSITDKIVTLKDIGIC